MTQLYIVSTWGFVDDLEIEALLKRVGATFLKIERPHHWAIFKAELTGEQIVQLAESYDVMIRQVVGEEKLIYLDTKTGKFRQR